MSPCLYILVMTGEEHRRNRFSLPYLGTGILGIFEETTVYALVCESYLVG